MDRDRVPPAEVYAELVFGDGVDEVLAGDGNHAVAAEVEIVPIVSAAVGDVEAAAEVILLRLIRDAGRKRVGDRARLKPIELDHLRRRGAAGDRGERRETPAHEARNERRDGRARVDFDFRRREQIRIERRRTDRRCKRRLIGRIRIHDAVGVHVHGSGIRARLDDRCPVVERAVAAQRRGARFDLGHECGRVIREVREVHVHGGLVQIEHVAGVASHGRAELALQGSFDGVAAGRRTQRPVAAADASALTVRGQDHSVEEMTNAILFDRRRIQRRGHNVELLGLQ